MDKIKEFLREKREVFLWISTLLLLFYVIFLIGELDFTLYYVGVESVLFLLVIYILISFFFYKEKIEIRKKYEKEKEEKERLKMEYISAEKELQDYFLLWVHQIKTPITVANLLLEEEYKEENEISLKAQMRYIETYTDMAINYLKLSKTETDMDITEVSLYDVVKEIVKKYSFFFIHERIFLELNLGEEKVISDSKWLSVLIEQIISNALKYTKKGKIKITFLEAEQVLCIEDTGIGIREEDIPKIFDKGYSGFNGRLNQKSSGLGLFLAKTIGDRLGILIEVESEMGKGSKFFLKFLSNLSKL